MNISSAILEGAKFLKSKYISSANIDSEILMSKAINKDKSFILLNSNIILTDKELKIFKKLIKERSNGKPVAYITNKK